MRGSAALALVIAAPLAASCMHAARPPGPVSIVAPPAADSLTVGLWRMDETGGSGVPDSSRLGLDGTAGAEARTDLGRFGRAREFSRSIDSFVFVPYQPALDTPRGLTVEAWIFPVSLGSFEDTPLAARWTEQANDRSWILSLVGLHLAPPITSSQSPGFHEDLVQNAEPGHLMFALQPEVASQPLAYSSATEIPLQRWTHVAVTFDGQVVQFFIDGRLDSQYALAARIRSSPAPLLLGNYFDPLLLTRFGGRLRVRDGADQTPYYAYQGAIDELRISSAAREGFPVTTGR